MVAQLKELTISLASIYHKNTLLLYLLSRSWDISFKVNSRQE